MNVCIGMIFIRSTCYIVVPLTNKEQSQRRGRYFNYTVLLLNHICMLLGQYKPTAKTNIRSRNIPQYLNIHIISGVFIQDKAYIE